jgi:hypothetical protein
MSLVARFVVSCHQTATRGRAPAPAPRSAGSRVRARRDSISRDIRRFEYTRYGVGPDHPSPHATWVPPTDCRGAECSLFGAGAPDRALHGNIIHSFIHSVPTRHETDTSEIPQTERRIGAPSSTIQDTLSPPFINHTRLPMCCFKVQRFGAAHASQGTRSWGRAARHTSIARSPPIKRHRSIYNRSLALSLGLFRRLISHVDNTSKSHPRAYAYASLVSRVAPRRRC